ncbi:MAG: Fe-S cluster assembly protein IscX, partial [Bacteroidales bacterium]|nr:Fe-S cluster assembly protein IscX [Bacteroidales bacterium]
MNKEFNWNEYSEIADLLNAQYPDTDLVNITEKEVEEMVNKLPG